VTIAASYIMKKNRLEPYEALSIVKKARPIAYPNEGFFEQLQIYHAVSYDLSTAPYYLAELVHKFSLKARLLYLFIKEGV